MGLTDMVFFRSRRLARRGRRLAGQTVLALVLGLILGVPAGPEAARAQDAGLSIELNKVEDVTGGCRGALVFQNNLGAALDRFNLDLILFDEGGIITGRIMVDMAPLRDGKTQVGMFRLTDTSCSGLSRILVNDIPACRAEDGAEVDCLAGLSVSSRSAVEFVK
jgi:hypothetical protein